MANDEPPDDFPDLRALKSGDEAAWTSAFRYLWPIAIRAASTPLAVLSYAEIEEVASEAIASAALKVGQASCSEQFKGLVAVIARRRAISATRAKLAKKRGPETLSLQQQAGEDMPEAEPAAPDTEPGRDLQLAELAVLLRKALATLTHLERKLLEGRVLHGLSQKQLGTQFGIEPGTVGAIICRALKKIRRFLDKVPNLMQLLREFLR